MALLMPCVLSALVTAVMFIMAAVLLFRKAELK